MQTSPPNRREHQPQKEIFKKQTIFFAYNIAIVHTYIYMYIYMKITHTTPRSLNAEKGHKHKTAREKDLFSSPWFDRIKTKMFVKDPQPCDPTLHLLARTCLHTNTTPAPLTNYLEQWFNSSTFTPAWHPCLTHEPHIIFILGQRLMLLLLNSIGTCHVPKCSAENNNLLSPCARVNAWGRNRNTDHNIPICLSISRLLFLPY